jgi:mRNA-degrading endonuclease RelE of RelBE toxin-antitoxin system
MRVAFTESAEEEFEALPSVIQARVRRLLVRLGSWPRVSGAKPLRGALAGGYRLRTGDYRVQFRVIEDVILVVRIGHRDRFYEQ